MENVLGTALWRQFGAALDTLDNALAACPERLWTARLWPEPPPEWFPRQFAELWYVAGHALQWLDLYLTGLPEEEFTPPPPFTPGELDSPDTAPAQPYTKALVRASLASTRRRSRQTLESLTDEGAGRRVEYPWTGGEPMSYLELQLYNLRHLQEHATQISLFLGQNGVSGEEVAWVGRAG
jgi:hypothetical protein